jgi:uncharacterized protein (TIGR02597 family)
MKLPLSVAAILFLLAGALLHAQNAGPEPVGFVTISCLGSSDTIVSLPLNRECVFTGAATAATATSGAVGTLTFSGSPFTASAYKYDSSTQTNTYFAFIASGTKAGSYYTITDNTTSTLTISLSGDDISGITSSVMVKIIPYWTLGTLFPSGSGVIASNGFTAATQILTPDLSSTGTNLAAAAIYYYSSTAGYWMQSGGSGSANDTILTPDNYFIVRNNTSTATSFTVAGSPPIHQLAIPLATSASARQDNPVAIARPLTVSLDDSGLVSSGAFTASSGFTSADQLFVFDNTVAQIHKAASRIYTYVNGAWRRSGTSGATGSDQIFEPGTGVLIRKASTASGASATWTNPVPFTY